LAFIVYASWLDPVSGRWSLIINLAVLAGSALYYRFIVLRRANWKLSAPEDLIV
jgi:hypothetical protein